MENRELFLSDEDLRMYGKLSAASRDLHDAIAFGSFIIKKGWKAKPWSRGSIYLQQSAFMTGMIVSYGRAFTRSDGWPKLPSDYISLYTADEAKLHDSVMKERHQIYAHSDSVSYPVRPFKSEAHSDIILYQVLEMSHEGIARLQRMCRKIAKACGEEKNRIKARY